MIAQGQGIDQIVVVVPYTTVDVAHDHSLSAETDICQPAEITRNRKVVFHIVSAPLVTHIPSSTTVGWDRLDAVDPGDPEGCL